MKALAFLFSRKLAALQQTAYRYVNYDAEKSDWVERLYLFYLLLILSGWTLAMLSWAVFTIGTNLANFRLPPAAVEQLLFFGLAFWLAITPALAYRSTDLYRFDLADLDFLGNAPLSARVVALGWFGRGLFKIAPGLFVLACGIIGSSVSYVQQGNDWLGLGLGLLSGASFWLIVSGLRWVLGLLRYRPGGRPGPLIGYGPTIIAIGLLVVPQVQFIFWPALLTSRLIVAKTPGASEVAGSVAGLGLTAALLIGGIYRVATSSRLAPALEDGKTGGRMRQAASLGGAAATEARLEKHVARRLSSKLAETAIPKLQGAKLVGVAGAIAYRQWLRLKRLPVSQTSVTGLGLIGGGMGAAAGLVGVSAVAPSGVSFGIAVQVAYFANLILMKAGGAALRRELNYPDFFAGWPTSRRRLLFYHLLPGFSLSLVSGEVALLLIGLLGPGWKVVAIWLPLWLMLLLTSALVTALEFERLLRKWAATTENVPKIGNGVIVVAGLVWVVTILAGPTLGFSAAIVVVSIYSTFVRGSNRRPT